MKTSFKIALIALGVTYSFGAGGAAGASYDEEYAKAKAQAMKIIEETNKAQQPPAPVNQGESIFATQDSTKKDFAGSSIRIDPTTTNQAPSASVAPQQYQSPSYQETAAPSSNVELTEEQIALLKSAARSKNLRAIQQKFFNKKYTGFENSITLEFEQGKTQKIRTRFAMATTVIFDSNVESYILGDTTGFKVEELPNMSNAIAIKPMLIGIDTSLTVFTKDKKMHLFYLFSTDYRNRENPNLVVRVKNTDEDKDKISLEEKAEKERIAKKYLILKEGEREELRIKRDEIYDKYKQLSLKVNQWLVAEEIFSDKQFTYFKFDKNKVPQMPVVFVVSQNEESPIDSRVIGDYLVVQTTAPRFTIRIGNSYVCVRRVEKSEEDAYQRLKAKQKKEEQLKEQLEKQGEDEEEIKRLFENVSPQIEPKTLFENTDDEGTTGYDKLQGTNPLKPRVRKRI